LASLLTLPVIEHTYRKGHHNNAEFIINLENPKTISSNHNKKMTVSAAFNELSGVLLLSVKIRLM